MELSKKRFFLEQARLLLEMRVRGENLHTVWRHREVGKVTQRTAESDETRLSTLRSGPDFSWKVPLERGLHSVQR